ncbi:MAG: glycosyl transferase family protein [Comamonadaceae bacterium]|nr:MAG: glycosyl transferase family protein [Comamonadaceae bacterium]
MTPGAVVILPFSQAVEVVAAFLAVLILVCCLDDLFIDLLYWGRRSWHRLGGNPPAPAPTAAGLRAQQEQPIAVLVPAWHEENVIGAMLENLARVMEYRSYVVFVGTYPNDAATGREVDRVAARHPHIRRVEMPHAGPTCKADCLNHVIAAAVRHQRAARMRFAGFVLHDSEDVPHPLELKLFNHLVRTVDMVQLPVVALERKWYELVAGAYMDEFAESHRKEMPLREHLCGMIPSAGVGTCFSRRAMRALWRQTRGTPFRTDSLTEDYEIGVRISQLGLRSRFVLCSIPPGPAGRGAASESLVAVREFFPGRLRDSYRQKGRWVLGIGLQAWKHLPLRDRPWRVALMMIHDRKGVITAFVPLAAYAVTAYLLVLLGGSSAGWWKPYDPVLFRDGSAWQALLYFNGGMLAVRASQRAYFTATLYGWAQGAASIPRMVVGNVVNCLAAGRAWRMYLDHRISGKPLAWDKTRHEFPTATAAPARGQPVAGIERHARAASPPPRRPAMPASLAPPRPQA